MSEHRLIDANELRNKVNLTDEEIDRYAKENVLIPQEWKRLATYLKAARDGFTMDIDEQPTIDPETLPIVQELRAKLKRYEQEGCLIELPCGVGEIVYSLKANTTQIYMCEVVGFDFRLLDINLYNICMKLLIFDDSISTIEPILVIAPISALGKTIFLTIEEAKAALKEMKLCANTI